MASTNTIRKEILHNPFNRGQWNALSSLFLSNGDTGSWRLTKSIASFLSLDPTNNKDNKPNALNITSSPTERPAEDLQFQGETVLFIDYALPMYDRYAGSRTNYMYLKTMLRMGMKIIYLPSDFKDIEPYSSELKSLGVKILTGSWYAENWRHWIKENSDQIDYAFLHKPIPALKFIDEIKAASNVIPIIYQCHDLHYMRLQRQAELSGDKSLRDESLAYKEKEDYILEASDSILTFSTIEEEIMRNSFPDKNIYTVPLYYYQAPPQPKEDFHQREGLLFVGGFDHLPNRDAVEWFCLEVFPLILKEKPDMTFNVVGGNPPEEIKKLSSMNIRILGSVTDDELSELYRRCRVVVVPLRFGAGVKGKVIESISNAIPIVSTSIGTEGIKGILDVAMPKDSPLEFAEETLRLYTSEELWTQRSIACSRLIKEELTEERTIAVLSEILIQAGIQGMARSQSAAITNTVEQPRVIAFYLPQYHPIPENDEWWGKGFTEWRNVCKAKPLFPGHYQPHIPADLGFYDLRSSDTRLAQADLARNHGIFGFCFYHYWFLGKRLLQRPIEEILATGEPSFPFCLCWANENWTRRWDGNESLILIEQKYSEEDDRAHIRELLRYFTDPRYIRVKGKPLFLVYRTENLPDPQRTSEIWREEARNAGIGELYLARVESIGQINPEDIGFDASIEFAPDWNAMGSIARTVTLEDSKNKEAIEIPRHVTEENYVRNYDELVSNMLQKKRPTYPWYRCVTPSWDNSSRRIDGGAVIQVGASPKKYEVWLKSVLHDATTQESRNSGFVFINAWNEWAEGNHLEPCLKYGQQYLQATRNAISDVLGEEYFQDMLKKTNEKKVPRPIGIERTNEEAGRMLEHVTNNDSPNSMIISLEEYYAIEAKTYFRGWAAINDLVTTENAEISLLLLAQGMKPRLVRPEKRQRQDITAHFSNKCNYDHSGFEALTHYVPNDAEIIFIIERDGVIYWQPHSYHRS